ncbi:MAG: antibiotic biosynthesis monooxygenase family protein, partial [Chloroflexia bacterium]
GYPKAERISDWQRISIHTKQLYRNLGGKRKSLGEPRNTLDMYVNATETVINKLPGYISANIHKSLDGTRVVNYAQWQSREAFEAMLRNPEVLPHMREAAKLATIEPHLYEVAFIDEVQQ